MGYGDRCNNPQILRYSDRCNNPKLAITSTHVPPSHLVLPGIHRHVTQRGNRREKAFFEDDGALYLDLMADATGRAQVTA